MPKNDKLNLHGLSVEEIVKVMVDTPPPPDRAEAKEKARRKAAGKKSQAEKNGAVS